MSDIGWHINSIPVLGTEPASENRIRSCRGSTPGIWFYCKLVTLVRCREIRGGNRFSGRVGGKWLCEMISAFIIKELRGALALRLFCGRSSFPPPETFSNKSRMVPKPKRDFAFMVISGQCCFIKNLDVSYQAGAKLGAKRKFAPRK